MDQKKIYIHLSSVFILYTGVFSTCTLQASDLENYLDMPVEKKVQKSSNLTNVLDKEFINNNFSVFRPSSSMIEGKEKSSKAILPPSIAPAYKALWDQIEAAESEGNQELAQLLIEQLSSVFSAGVGQVVAFPDVETKKKPKVRTPKTSPRTLEPLKEQLNTTREKRKQTRPKRTMTESPRSKAVEPDTLVTPYPEITITLNDTTGEQTDHAHLQPSLLSMSDDTLSTSYSSLSSSDPEESTTRHKISSWDLAKKLSTDSDDVRSPETKEKNSS